MLHCLTAVFFLSANYNELGCTVIFTPDMCFWQALAFIILIEKGSLSDGFYYFEECGGYVVKATTEVSPTLWHQHSSHAY